MRRVVHSITVWLKPCRLNQAFGDFANPPHVAPAEGRRASWPLLRKWGTSRLAKSLIRRLGLPRAYHHGALARDKRTPSLESETGRALVLNVVWDSGRVRELHEGGQSRWNVPHTIGAFVPTPELLEHGCGGRARRRRVGVRPGSGGRASVVSTGFLNSEAVAALVRELMASFNQGSVVQEAADAAPRRAQADNEALWPEMDRRLSSLGVAPAVSAGSAAKVL